MPESVSFQLWCIIEKTNKHWQLHLPHLKMIIQNGKLYMYYLSHDQQVMLLCVIKK